MRTRVRSGRTLSVVADSADFQVEFTVEPFVEGNPGPHVTAALRAAEELGTDIEFGPFGSGCRASSERLPELVASITRAAFAHGATHVNLDVTATGDVTATEDPA